MAWIWDILQIEETTDQRKIKRAYAARSREIHPEERPQEFQHLYRAYQAALQYASSGKSVIMCSEPEIRQEEEEKAASEIRQREEDRPVSEEQDIYNILGESSEKLEKQWAGMGEIKYFQSYLRRQLSLWEQDRKFLDDRWVGYLQSERFQKIMWSPIVMETISAALFKYFQEEQQVLLLFGNLYKLDQYEKGEEGSFREESLRKLYRSLFPALQEGSMQQRKNINIFLANWENQKNAWRNGRGFLEEWKEYLGSESFAAIMWTNTVLEAIVKEMRGSFPCHEEAALFFWDLYGLELLEKENYEGKKLELYRTLYPSYVYHLRRMEYGKNRENIIKKENRHIYKILLIGAGILLLFVVLLFIFPETENVLLILYAIFLYKVVAFFIKKIISR